MHSCNGSLGIAIKPTPGGNVRKALVLLLLLLLLLLYIAFVTPIFLLLIAGN